MLFTVLVFRQVSVGSALGNRFLIAMPNCQLKFLSHAGQLTMLIDSHIVYYHMTHFDISHYTGGCQYNVVQPLLVMIL